MTGDSKFHHGDSKSAAPIIEMKDIENHFGNVIALSGVSFDVRAGECQCLLGDNGAGKSTFIKTMSGVHRPNCVSIIFEGRPNLCQSARRDGSRDCNGDSGSGDDPADVGCPQLLHGAQADQGPEPTRRFDVANANAITMPEMKKIGINLRAPDQTEGSLSGGERQAVAIARAMHFGANEPTSAPGVRQTSNMLATIGRVRAQGVGGVFISHNFRHAMAVGDRFTALNRGKSMGTVARGEITSEQLQDLVAGRAGTGTA